MTGRRTWLAVAAIWTAALGWWEWAPESVPAPDPLRGSENRNRSAAVLAPRAPLGMSEVLLLAWAEREPERATVWLRELPAGAPRDRLIAAWLASWSHDAPVVAAAYVQALPTGEFQTQATASVAAAWGTKHPAAAAAWIEELPSGAARRYAIEVLAARWVTHEPDAVAAWLERLPDGADQDAAFNAIAGAFVEAHPGLATRLAASISDEGLRLPQLERALRRWREMDFTAAYAWVNAAPMSPAWKAEMLGGK